MLAIVIPTYDMHTHGVHFLARALDSIKKQTGIDLSQVDVVVSDHSVNFEIETFLSSYQAPFKLHYVRNSTHFGNISQNLNHAIQFVLQKCTSSYIKILFQDDFLLGNDYLAGIARIAQDAKPDTIFTGATHSADGTTFYNPISPQNNPFLIFGQNSISSPSTLTLSRQVCQEQLCDENVQLFMDIDWYYRIFKTYSSIVFAPELLVVNGVWDGQMQHQFDAQSFAKELSYVLNKYESDGLRSQLPAYLMLLQEKHPEHAAIVDPLVRPLIERNTIPLDATNLSSTQHSIDVVLTTYNAADQINFSIRNALSQSVPPKTIIVVDANSSDHTAQMVQRIYAQEPKVRLISCPNSQIWLARQLGINQADSAYIAFLHCAPDTYPKWNTNYLEQQLAHLSKNPGATGSLGNITLAPQDETQRNDCLINLPSAGCASNLLLIRNECTTNALLEDQLRLAEQHGQWQLLEALFSLAQAPNAKVITSQPAQTDEAIANEKILQILTWWSAYPQLILTQTQLLTLIRHVFIGAIGSTQPSLLTHLAIFNHRYQLFKPALNQDIFVRACISYLNMAGEVIKTHCQKQYSAIKTQIARLPLANKVHQALCR